MKLGLILAVALLMSMPSFAAITACPAAATPLSNTDPPAPPAFSPADPNNGCSSLNLQFSNFVVGTINGGLGGAVINGITIEPNAGGVAPPTSSALTGASPAGSFFEITPIPANGPGFGCDPNSGSAGWCINGGGITLSSTVTYQVTTSSGTFNSYNVSVSAAEHTVGGAGSGLPAQATFFREICIGTTTFTTDAVGTTTCAGGSYFVMQLGTLSFAGHSNVYNTAFLGVSFAPQTQAAIRDTVFLKTQNGNGSWAAIGAADFLTPEPGTFVLLGTALVGLGFARFRLRKKA